MFKNYLEFIKNNNRSNIFESINDDKLNQYILKISSLLSKHIEKLMPIVGLVNTRSKGEKFISKQYVVIYKNSYATFQINWKENSDNVDAYSIDFFDNIDILFSGKAKSKLTIYTLGSSLVYFLPIIWTVVNSKNYSLSEKEAISLGRSIFGKNVKESYYVGSLRYLIVEEKDDITSLRDKKYAELLHANSKRNESPEAMQRYSNLMNEYKSIIQAIKGGAKTVSDIKIEVEKNIGVNILQSEEERKQEQKLKEEIHEDPEVTFKKMRGYINMVIKGFNPSLIICGAPGVGKTYNVKKQLKEEGYIEDKNLCTIKGKCTPRQLYLALYQFKRKGDILVIDDADSLVGPKAPEDSINILKGALDSTSEPEGRLITYGIAGKILDNDGNEIPKKFYYNGSVIILTNYNAGSLDTALRGRSYIQDIHFSVDDVLKIIKKLLPSLGEGKVSMQSKNKAFDYLSELADQKTEMEISIRTFNICAVLFESMEGVDEDIIMSMIKEQMELQAARRESNRNAKY